MIYIGNMTQLLFAYICYPSIRIVAGENED